MMTNSKSKRAVIVVIACALLMTSSCGKKKETLGPKPTEQNLNPPSGGGAPAPKANEPSPSVGKGEDKRAPAELPVLPSEGDKKPSSDEDSQLPDQAGGAGGGNSGGGNTGGDDNDSEYEGSLKDSKTLASDLNSPAAKEDFIYVEDKRMTGLQAGELFYSGAGSDEMLEYFKNLNNSVSAGQRRNNMQMASRIESVKAVLPQIQDGGADEFSSDVNLQIKLTSGEILMLSGVEDGMGFAKLKQVRLKNSGDLRVEGFLKCVDSSGACENSYAKLKFSNSSVVRIIFRQSVANFKFVTPKSADNHALTYWNAFIENGLNMVKTTNTKLKQIQLSTVEIVNGRSAVEVEISSHDPQVIRFQGPLVVSESGNSVRQPMKKVFKARDDQDLFVSDYEESYQYANLISKIGMVKNTGRGQMRFELVLNREDEPKSPIIYMTLAHKPSDVLSADEIISFESRLK